MAKGIKNNKILLVSSEGPGFFYVTKKNSRKKPEKLKKMKYHKFLRKHVLFEEKKI